MRHLLRTIRIFLALKWEETREGWKTLGLILGGFLVLVTAFIGIGELIRLWPWYSKVLDIQFYPGNRLATDFGLGFVGIIFPLCLAVVVFMLGASVYYGVRGVPVFFQWLADNWEEAQRQASETPNASTVKTMRETDRGQGFVTVKNLGAYQPSVKKAPTKKRKKS